MVFNATFNNISVIWSVLLVEETGVPVENHPPICRKSLRLKNIVLYFIWLIKI